MAVRPIMVGVDGSESAAAALTWAVAEGVRRDLPLEAVLAWSYLDQHDAEGDGGFDPAYTEADAQEALDVYVTEVVGDADVRRRLVCDIPAEALAAASVEASLLVVGARGLGGFARLGLGSTSDAILTRSASPVVIVRGQGGDGPVVVGVDTSPGTERVLRAAVDEAVHRDGNLLAVTAWERPPFAEWALEDDAPYFARFERRRAEALETAIAAVDTTGLSVERRVVVGSAAAAILDAEEETSAALVVVGSRGAPALVGAVLGSVSRQVVHHARGPVLVVRP